MNAFLRLGCLAVIFLFSHPVFSQNLLITYQNSDALFVCGADTFFVQVKNTGTTPITDAALTEALPTGIIYQPGSIVGATEQNVANPGSPVFGLPVLPVGADGICRFAAFRRWCSGGGARRRAVVRCQPGRAFFPGRCADTHPAFFHRNRFVTDRQRGSRVVERRTLRYLVSPDMGAQYPPGQDRRAAF